MFTVEGRHYADPNLDFGDCANESRATVADALPRPSAWLRYRYDFGDCWDHTVTCEKVLDRSAAGPLPVCTGGRDAAPIEDLIPDDEREAPAFDRERVTHALVRADARP